MLDGVAGLEDEIRYRVDIVRFAKLPLMERDLLRGICKRFKSDINQYISIE